MTFQITTPNGGSDSLNFKNFGGTSIGSITATDAVGLSIQANNITIPTGSLLNSSGRPMLSQTGGIIQTVVATNSTQSSTQSSSYQATGLTASITPLSTSSKILVIVSQNIGSQTATTGRDETRGNWALYRNGLSGTQLTEDFWYLQVQGTSGTNNKSLFVSMPCIYLDSPATTSSVTYATYMKIASADTGGTYQTIYGQYSNEISTITLLEIAQ